MKITKSEIKKYLPNFPDEVIQIWLLPLTEDYGWPPEEGVDGWPPLTGRGWGSGILNLIKGWSIFQKSGVYKCLDCWRLMNWEKVELPLNTILLFDGSWVLEGMYDKYIKGGKFWDINDGKQRFIKVFQYICNNGDIPKPLIFLKKKGQYSILDGNHRFLAWDVRHRIYEIDEKESNTILFDSGIELDCICPQIDKPMCWVATCE